MTIRGVSESMPPSSYVKEVLGPAFTKATGINVKPAFSRFFRRNMQKSTEL